MDEKTNVQNLKEKVKKFCDDRDWGQFHNPKDLAIGLSTESNELLSLFRFKNIDEMIQLFKNPIKKEEISDEIADIFFFLLRFSQMYNIDLSEALDYKIEKNDKKYAISKFKGSNKKYDEL